VRRSRLLLATAVLAATAVLIALGIWQLRRLAWKEELIATIEARIAAPARSLEEIEALWRQTADVEYWPVSPTGTFRHEGEQYYYTTRKGAVGWDVYAPLELANGRVLIVNRGFVPDAHRDPSTRAEGQVEGQVSVEGLARNPVSEKPNPFVPDNEPARRTFFWRDLPAMASAAGVDADKLVPFFLDARENDVPGGLPAGGSTVVDLPNNHLQYAVTWFGLAICCVVVGGLLLLRDARRDS
jgi:surfeit locus 1 family protein